MSIVIQLEHLIKTAAMKMFQEIPEAAKTAISEQDIQHECDKQIDTFLNNLKDNDFGIDIEKITSHNQVRAGTGLIDTVYGNVIIEYKKPGVMDSETGRQKLIEQIQSRFKPLEKESGIPQENIFGVGWDGYQILFVTKKGKEFDTIEAQKTTIYSLKKLLKAILKQGVIGRSFTPENLAESFGGENEKTKDSILNIYSALNKSTDTHTEILYGQWKKLFSEVCGFDLSKENKKLIELAEFYNVYKKGLDGTKFLYSVHTYYSMVMKLMSGELITSGEKFRLSPAKIFLTLPSRELKDKITEFESGGIWKQFGITNFLEGDLFGWYLGDWCEEIAEVIRNISERFFDFNPATITTEGDRRKDLLKSLYQLLFPKKLRHDLGEYYTPDWLAEQVMNDLGYVDSLENLADKRLLDPACGSGTFLVEAINRVMEWNDKQSYENRCSEEELLKKITNNIIGFDLNPLATITSRLNYLMTVSDLIKHAGGIEIPVYMCDSIMTPSDYGSLSGRVYNIDTVVGEFGIPYEIKESREKVEKFMQYIESCIENNYTVEDFLDGCRARDLLKKDEPAFITIYKKMQELNKEGKNGIWARILKNAFAPLFISKVDFVAGNPPWVNWESLPDGYRNSKSHKDLWDRYDLRPEKGQLGRMKGGKKDLSMLMTYVVVDEYLKIDGKIGFVITQSVFKTKGGGDGFRKFNYQVKTNGKEYIYIHPLQVHDLSDFQCFEGATNRASIFIAQKTKEPFRYPIPYTTWKKTSRARIGTKFTLGEVYANTKRKKVRAEPVDRKSPTSPWLTAPRDALKGIKKILGKSDYKAHEGVNSGGLNGVYWIRVLEYFPNGDLLIENMGNIGKIKVRTVQRRIEGDLVYPLLRGRDVKRWNAEPSHYFINPQDKEDVRCGIPSKTMKIKYEKTYSYFFNFRKEISDRADRKYYPKDSPFYTVRNVARYTMSPWKVVWTRVASDVKAGVIGKSVIAGKKRIVFPVETATMIPFETKKEADYVCSIINSKPFRLLIKTTSVAGTGGFAPPNIIKKGKIPKFDPDNKTHQQLAKLSEQCHKLSKQDDQDGIKKLEVEIDKLSAELWEITDSELLAIQSAIEEI
jgi:Eco57I restriction-modification methylase